MNFLHILTHEPAHDDSLTVVDGNLGLDFAYREYRLIDSIRCRFEDCRGEEKTNDRGNKSCHTGGHRGINRASIIDKSIKFNNTRSQAKLNSIGIWPHRGFHLQGYACIFSFPRTRRVWNYWCISRPLCGRELRRIKLCRIAKFPDDFDFCRASAFGSYFWRAYKIDAFLLA